MLVFSESSSTVKELGFTKGQNKDSALNCGDFTDSLSPILPVPLNLFDGTEFAKSASEAMSQEFDPTNFCITDEELRVNFGDWLNDPMLGSQDLNELLTFDDSSSKSAENVVKTESTTSPRQQQQFLENETDEVEEVERASSASSSTSSAGSSNQLNEMDTTPRTQSQFQVQDQQQQQRSVAPRIAFNNGLLTSAPPSNGVTNFSRLVKFNPQQPQYQNRVTSNFSASDYSPPPTPVSSNSRYNSSNYSTSKMAEQNSNHTRGAAYARQYRQKNREHMEQLETENNRLKQDNDQLRQGFDQVRSQNDKLSREVEYLRQILQNQSAIASILNAVTCNAPGLKFQFPLSSNANQSIEDQQQKLEAGRTVETRASSKRKINDDQLHQQSKKSKNDESNSAGAGVCLHVNGSTVSVEFCARCNRESRCVTEQWKRQQQ